MRLALLVKIAKPKAATYPLMEQRKVRFGLGPLTSDGAPVRLVTFPLMEQRSGLLIYCIYINTRGLCWLRPLGNVPYSTYYDALQYWPLTNCNLKGC
ncbi:MAG: hypothetical protein QNL04_06190 [SAR324 cluster bacterium]|nr:hypothetical protein [SAR324 cluster bacterium]